jgi:chemotaxis protein MotB
MPAPKNTPVIIIKKNAHGKHGHHGGAWKVAYADFVTAMMAFFLVMWLVSQSPAKKAAVAAYFRDPGVFELTRGQGVLDGSATAAEAVETQGADEARAILERAAEELRKTLEGMPEFAELKSRIEIQLTPEGLRIELLEGATEGFFEVGSSRFKPETVTLLQVIATKLGRLSNKVAVEGHTDSRPYNSTDQFSNWELSTDRANAARRVLQQAGLNVHQVEAVRGYADSRLRFPDSPLDARNRRISIVVRDSVQTAPPAGAAAPGSH